MCSKWDSDRASQLTLSKYRNKWFFLHNNIPHRRHTSLHSHIHSQSHILVWNSVSIRGNKILRFGLFFWKSSRGGGHIQKNVAYFGLFEIFPKQNIQIVWSSLKDAPLKKSCCLFGHCPFGRGLAVTRFSPLPGVPHISHFFPQPHFRPGNFSPPNYTGGF